MHSLKDWGELKKQAYSGGEQIETSRLSLVLTCCDRPLFSGD